MRFKRKEVIDMAISTATTREVFEVKITTFEDQLDREARTAKTVGTIVFLILTLSMVLGG
jgi:hypothetical protein